MIMYEVLPEKFPYDGMSHQDLVNGLIENFNKTKFVCSLVRSLVRSFVRSLVRSLVGWLVGWLVRSFVSDVERLSLSSDFGTASLRALFDSCFNQNPQQRPMFERTFSSPSFASCSLFHRDCDELRYRARFSTARCKTEEHRTASRGDEHAGDQPSARFA